MPDGIRITFVRRYEVHCDACGSAVENDEKGGFLFDSTDDATEAAKRHVEEHKE